MGLNQKKQDLDTNQPDQEDVTTKGKDIVIGNQINELVFCVVGHIGSGTSQIAKALSALLTQENYKCAIIKASDLIIQRSQMDIVGLSKLQRVEALQDAGDALRRGKDSSIVARLFISAIRKIRADFMGVEYEPSKAVVPDEQKRAYIFDSVKHPQEIEMLRKVYKNSFISIGVVCDEDIRATRVKDKLDINVSQATDLMKRDAKDGGNKNGQRVSDAFHLSDFFMDNTENEKVDGNPNPEWVINDHLARLLSIITHKIVVRPTLSETAMFHAHGSRLKSACLSRQVGAALVDSKGEIISTGKNEVPRAGGGTYSDGFSSEGDSIDDGRCFTKPHFTGDKALSHTSPYCSNDTEKITIINEIVKEIVDAIKTPIETSTLFAVLNDSRISGLIEFSRAIHAEMDAILSALRQGKSIVGSKLFVTTFPCHYCARHIVTAGVDEVQYIEPYPKSLAYKLHYDSISLKPGPKGLPSNGGKKVVFKPFTGVAPKLYQRAFLKDRDLKDDKGMFKIGTPDWGTCWTSSKMSIGELECELAAEL
jgi:deoxycytidylate deaminase